MPHLIPGQQQLPIQPVHRPILCSPFSEPTKHWVYDTLSGDASAADGRRPASYWYQNQRTGGSQLGMFAEEERDDLPLVNALRTDVRRWREQGYPNAESITRQLLRYWAREDRVRPLFFCQLEAVETVIYLREILASGKRLPWQRLELSREDYELLSEGKRPRSIGDPLAKNYPVLVDIPNETDIPPLPRYGCKMATGSGKTVVMAMLIAWTLCNRGRKPRDERFPGSVLVVCPNLTVKERLQVLRPSRDDNYYVGFDLVPSSLLPELRKGKVLVENWHQFAPASPHVEGGKTYPVVKKGPESPSAFSQRVLGDLYERGALMVLNDEAHHAYRPAPLQESTLSAEEKAEREEATVWISGLDRINMGCGVGFCVDLSATPFYLQGSGYIEGSPFPWLVSDFGLVDAIESGIVKIPRLPVSDTTGRPEPKYFALWKHITDRLQPGERLPGRGRKPKPDVVWREAEDALRTLAGQWKERWEYIQQATPAQEHTPPVLIIVCDNTEIAEVFYRNISGEEQVEVLDLDSDDDDSESPSLNPRGRRRLRSRVAYGAGKLIPEFENREGFRPTLRIDSKLLAEAENELGTGTRQDAAQALREVVATVGKPGTPGEHIRCVVSVQMLSEGWDANNVTHIFGLRAFGSQLLCEQVVGRGLRRMDYTPDPNTGLLTEEYVDVYGVPFSVIPFKGRETKKAAPEDKPKNHVRTLPDRGSYRIEFPIVEGYAFALERNLVVADIAQMEPLVLDAGDTPSAVFVRPQVGYQTGTPSMAGGFETIEQTREEYYEGTHLQTIKFELARQLVFRITDAVSTASASERLRMRLLSRHQLFPQVYRIVDEFVRTKVRAEGCDIRDLGLQRYAIQVVERLAAAIQPNDAEGEPPLLPILNRHRPLGSTDGVDFKTTKPVFGTVKSHLNAVAADTTEWEQSAAFRLEQSPHVFCYARNDRLEFTIPYEFLNVNHSYTPDYLVRMVNGSTVIVEIKGWENEQDKAKHEAARRWVAAVNHWGRLGLWRFHVCRNPQMLGRELEYIATAQ